MKIVVVSQYYAPEPIPIPQSVAQGLAARGHQVSVVTAFPNYPQGRLYSGFEQKWGVTERDGDVTVHRVPVFISHSNSAIGRMINYLTFGFNSARVRGLAREADVVYSYATQMTAAIGPSLWRTFARTPFVMHVQDLWPESVTGSSMVGGRTVQRLVAAVLRPWLRHLYRSSSATIGISPGMTNILVDRGVPQERAHALYNWAQTSELELAGPEARARDAAGFSVMYAGNIGEMQDLDTVVKAATLVADLEGFTVTIVGSGVAEARLRALVDKERITNVIFVGRIPFRDMGSLYDASDFQLVTLKDLDIFRATIPSKLQSSLAIGIPVITTVAGDVRDLVERENVGYASAPGNPEALAAVFRTAYATSRQERIDMGLRARAFYESSMQRDKGIDAIERILTEAASTRAGERT